MPLYVADYRADTAHLSAAQHGAYLLLIMHYWQMGRLPDDEKTLARIACMTPAEWRRNRSAIEAFFEPGWRHGRIEEELDKSAKISSDRRAAAMLMHEERRAKVDAKADAKDDAKAHAKDEQAHPQSQSHPPLDRYFKKVGVGVKSEAPRHGAISRDRKFVYFRAGTDEWVAYSRDYHSKHGKPPTPNAHGGRWFNVQGECA
jgi:uncharacterized protein YdaU (DUF1376 family)